MLNRLKLEVKKEPADFSIRVPPQKREFLDRVFTTHFKPPDILTEYLKWEYDNLANRWTTPAGSVFLPDKTTIEEAICTFEVTKTVYLSELLIHSERFMDIADALIMMGAAKVHTPTPSRSQLDKLFDPNGILPSEAPKPQPCSGKVQIAKADLNAINLKRYAKGQSWLDKLESV